MGPEYEDREELGKKRRIRREKEVKEGHHNN